MSNNIKPRLHFQNNTNIIRVMTRYHLQWQCLCLFYLNSDNDLVVAVLNKETVMPVKVCSTDYFINQTRVKTDSEPLTSADLERFKTRLGVADQSVRFVHQLKKLLGD